jgi:all-trans-8'-apo-beta-carotenal 15,15'-oxygenase
MILDVACGRTLHRKETAMEPTPTPLRAKTEPSRHAAIPKVSHAFRDFTDEHGFEPLAVSGKLPVSLRGTLYRNGPGEFSNHGRPYRHWFDGDGTVSAVRFDAGRADGAVRILDTPYRAKEREAGRALYANYGSQPAQWWRRPLPKGKNTANTSVMLWQDRLFALQEGSRPFEIDPDTLGSIGETDLDGLVAATFSAHPHWVTSRNEGYNFGTRYGRETVLDVYALPRDGKPRRLAAIPIAPTMIHDFVATDRHLVFFAPPLRARVLGLLLGLRSYSDSLEWKPSLGTEVIVVPIDEPARVTRFEVDAFYQWHFANAYDDGDEIVVDFVRYPDFTSNTAFSGLLDDRTRGPVDGRLVRARVDARNRRMSWAPLADDSSEFPQVAFSRLGREHGFVYMASSMHDEQPLVHGITKVDVRAGRAERFDFGPESVVSEPVFVAREDAGAEDDGFLLAHVYDRIEDRTRVAVLDARSVANGPIAEARFGHRLPLTFHGIFTKRLAKG